MRYFILLQATFDFVYTPNFSELWNFLLEQYFLQARCYSCRTTNSLKVLNV